MMAQGEPAGADTVDRPSRSSPEFAAQVRTMFDRIAGVYDLMNTAMTVGMHHRWRQRAADRAELRPGDAALDVCCGTGDLALELARRGGPRWPRRGLRLLRADARAGAAQGRGARRIARSGSSGPTRSSCPTTTGSFDAVTVGFGVRNLADLERGLAEMARVLKPGRPRW